jgi:chaperonin GroEL
VEEGIVPGGGVALLKCSKVLDTLKVDGDQKVGVDIVRRAVEAPMRWIATNAGVEGSIVVQKVRDNKDANYGYNAATDTYEDMVKVLTTEAMVADIPEPKSEAPAGGGPGGGMGGMY